MLQLRWTSVRFPLSFCSGNIATKMASAPVVNGISPKEGSPRTKLTIRGENLGGSAEDLIGT